MRTIEEIQEEIVYLNGYLENLRVQPEKYAYKIVLTEMRIETLQWVIEK